MRLEIFERRPNFELHYRRQIASLYRCCVFLTAEGDDLSVHGDNLEKVGTPDVTQLPEFYCGVVILTLKIHQKIFELLGGYHSVGNYVHIGFYLPGTCFEVQG